MQIIRYTLLFMVLAGSSVFAKLEWQQEIFDIDADVGETEIKVEYIFTNNSDDSVEIGRVQTSCGCTSAQLSKKIYAPGESGSIPVTFEFGGRQGKQSKTIRVTTKEETYTLSLKVDIPILYQVNPRLHYWRKGNVGEVKQFEINVPDSEIVKNITFTNKDEELWKIEIETSDDGYLLNVTPLKYSPNTIQSVKLEIEMGNRTETELVYLRQI